MYTASHPVSQATMNGMGSSIIGDDGSGTINPAALNTPVLASSGAISQNSGPRGQKRSRSPEGYHESQGNADDADSRQSKRGRPTSSGARPDTGNSEHASAQTQQRPSQQTPTTAQTPRAQAQGNSQQGGTNAATPAQATPPKATPSKSVVKALPTVRDHTTDQLSPDGDEYIPREYDDAGEKKVSPNGRPLDGREYKCRTFLVPNRGDKLFMLATECARVLGYRDSYLLFNKNRSLFKIIATQAEKDDLIGQEILPYSYRSRQIAIVTAKSMFRQFGSRVIQGGRRVRDDYWEAKARKQGFTEEDLAGEKRPGGAKAAREAQEAAQANLNALHHNDVVYSNGPGTVTVDAHGHPQLIHAGMGHMAGNSLAPLPMIALAPSEEVRLREYGGIPRPRQDMAPTPYQDRSQPSPMTDIMNQATNTADVNKILNQQHRQRSKELNDYWNRPRDVNVSSPLQQTGESAPTIAQSLQSPHLSQGQAISAGQQPMLQHQTSQIMGATQPYPQPHHQASQSPASTRNIQAQPQPQPSQQTQQTQQQSIRPDQVSQRSSTMNYGSNAMSQSQYGYQPSSNMWGQPPPQPQPSPISSHHSMPQYSPQQHHTQSPHHSQSPHQPPQQSPAQLQHTQSSSSMQAGAMSYQNMPSMAGYGGMAGRSMYQQPGQGSPTQHQYLQQTTAGSGAPQPWAPPTQQGHAGQQQWQGGY